MKCSAFTVLTLSLYFFYFPIHAQQNQRLDSLVQLYKKEKNDTIRLQLINDIINIELYSRPDEAKRYAKELITLSKNLKKPKWEAKGYHRMGGFFVYKDEIDSAEFYYQKSLDINKVINNLEGMLSDNEQFGLLYIRKNDFNSAFDHLNENIALFKERDTTINLKNSAFNGIGGTYHTLSSAYLQKGMYQLALKNELMALQFYKESKGPLYVADAQNSLGTIEINIGNFLSAVDYLKPALQTYRDYNDTYFEMLTLHNLGICYKELNQPEKAKEYYSQSIALAAKNNYTGREALTINNLGDLYLKLEQKEKAVNSYQQSILLYKKMNYPPEINAPYNGLGELYLQFGQPQKALEFLNKAITISDSTGQIKTAAFAYKNRYEALKRLGKYARAIEDLESHYTLKDSMFNVTKSRQIEEMRAIFDTEKKEQQIAQQETEINLLEEQKKVSELQKIALGSGLGLSTLVLGFGFYGFRQKIKRNRLEKEKVNAELAFKKKELTTHALHLAKKNEVLEGLKQKALELKKTNDGGKAYQELINTINFDQQDDKNWENFTQYFEAIHKDFAMNIKKRYPEVTKNELRFMALLKMNMSSKEIASILNISIAGVKKARNRLRKKLQINPQDSLEALIISI